MTNYEYIFSSQLINSKNKDTITHSLEYRLDARFQIFLVDGDETKVLATNNRSSDYILYWLEEKNWENGQIKVIGPLSRERKWEKEEEIKNHLRRNIRITKQLLTEINNFSEPRDGMSLNASCPISYKSHLGVTICTQQDISGGV